MTIKLHPLPYAYDALAPHMSAETVEVHYERHHAGYVKKANELIAGTEFEDMELEQIIRRTSGIKKHQKIFNQAAQVWNHDLFWRSMSPRGGDGPRDPSVVEAIEKSFGGHAAFAAEFAKEATAQFGSGYAWLVADKAGKLKITTTSNADNPLAMGEHALIACDVWEHAYYIDQRNKRDAFLKAFLDHLINWDQVAEVLSDLPATGEAKGRAERSGARA